MEIIDKVAVTGNRQSKYSLFFLDLKNDGTYQTNEELYLSLLDNISIHSILLNKNIVYMADSINNKIYKYDYDKHMLEETNVGRDPRHMCTDNDIMYIANFESDNISTIDLNSFSLVGSIPAEIKPHDVKLFGSNLYTSCYEENIIIENNLQNGNKQYYNTDGKPMHLFVNDEKIIVMTYYVNGTISSKINFIDRKSNKINKIIKIQGLSSDIDFDEENNLLYLINIEDKCLYIMDTEKMNIIKKLFLGGYPESLCFSKENIYVTNSKKNQIDVIEKKSLSIVNNIKLDFAPDLIKVLNK